MTNAYHISDPHLSFDAVGQPVKLMTERKWSKGCSSFDGYLDKISDFGTNVIKSTDFTFITGDIVHDMKEHMVLNSLKWLRNRINGTIIICRGNHDKGWKPATMRQAITHLKDMYIMDEGEIMSIGQYTIGCYSNHSEKTRGFTENDPRYLDMARLVSEQAKEKHTKAVMMSHYPVNKDMAESIGKLGVKAYMSGHVHCTNNQQGIPDCAEWDWYNQSAGLTDDLVINGCFFSTGTVDVLIKKHNAPFKKIECLSAFSVDHQEVNRHKGAAAKAFGCDHKFVNKFEKQDPFNDNELVGHICRQKGKMQGSLYITHVNGKAVSPQLIYGTPKLEYPYKSDNSREFMILPNRMKYAIGEKWNGMNVVIFKYQDGYGNTFVSAKSKGTPFLTDTEFGNFLTLTKEALNKNDVTNINMMLKHPDFMDDEVQSLSFELCGTKEPHLVKYNFDIDLKPLFTTFKDGRIKPFEPEFASDLVVTDDFIINVCKTHQDLDFKANKEYRAKNNLPHKYEYNHFIVEGKVLYILDEEGFLQNRTMYKVKPEDVEDVHWETFDKTMQGRVRECIGKIKSNGDNVSEDTLKQELDMGPKEWGRFGKAIMEYIKSGEAKANELVVLCGLPGSGKSTVARILENKGYIRINQDELGSRNACKKIADGALRAGKNVVVDRVNFDVRQRQSWIDLAHTHGVTNIRCMVINVPVEVCIERATKRVDHPTIKDAETAVKAVTALAELFTPPTMEEGFVEILQVEQDVPAHEIVKKITG